MSFFVLDLETLGIESTSVVLSIGMVYVDPDILPTDPNKAYQYLMQKESVFVKLKSKAQTFEPYYRTVDMSTYEWWKKQGEYQKQHAIQPTEHDLDVPEGIAILRSFFTSKPNYKNLPMWVRGSLDQPVFQSLLNSYKLPPFIDYNCYRDVRTAIDIIYEHSKNGYVDIHGFDRDQVIKHHPVHDCAYDAIQLIRGKTD